VLKRASCNRRKRGAFLGEMYSDDEEDQPTEVGSPDDHDKKLEEQWSKKVRRRSSALKLFFEDQLELRENQKIASQLRKYGELMWI